jgi:hypothetical protein
LQEVLLENQRQEALATIAAGDLITTIDGRVGIALSADEGWQGKGSGRNYNSLSGHNFGVGCHTKLPLALQVFCKKCAICLRREKNAAAAAADDENNNNDDDDDDRDAVAEALENEEQVEIQQQQQQDDDDETETLHMLIQLIKPATDHRCPKNFDGSLKAMEAIATACILACLWKSGICHVRDLVTDDDSTTRSACTHDLSLIKKDFPDAPREHCWQKVEIKKGERKGQGNKQGQTTPLHA